MEKPKKEGNVLKKAVEEFAKEAKNQGDKVIDAAPIVAKKVVDAADDVTDKLKEGGGKLVDAIHIAKIKADRIKLKPIFEEDISEGKLGIPTIIHIVEYDKKHMESEACIGSIGYWDDIPKSNARVLNIYNKFIKLFGMEFYPNTVESLYYLTPFDNRKYVNINEYFQYEEKLRVAELNDIAYALGAKTLRIDIVEKKISYAKKKAKVGAKVNTPVGNADGGFEDESESESFVIKEQGSIVNLGGNNNPSAPELKYYKNDPDIMSLINMRMSGTNSITDKKYTLKYNAHSLIHKTQAAHLDAALNMYELDGGNASISATYEEQNRMRFEYYIEFPSSDNKDKD